VGAGLKGRLHTEVRLLESSVLSPLSLGCRPAIGCRERVKGMGAVLRVFLDGDQSPDSDLLSRPSTYNTD